MPLPDAAPTPPPYGLFGPIVPSSDGQLKEKAPDGGVVVWKLENVGGAKKWMPTHVPGDKNTEA